MGGGTLLLLLTTSDEAVAVVPTCLVATITALPLASDPAWTTITNL